MILKNLSQSIFIYRLFTFDCSLESLVREQYELAKKGISLTESSILPLFEKEALVNLILTDKKNEMEQLKEI